MERRDIEKVAELYRSGLSQKEIALRCGVNLRQIQRVMEKNGIKRRTQSEATYVKRNPLGDPFKIKSHLSSSDYFLKGLGLGLYWGEGNKKNQNSIRLGNTDPRLIKKFIDFLIKICGVKREKIRFGLQIFGDHNPQEVITWWTKQLLFDKKYFQKPVVTRRRGEGTYKEWSNKGVVTVYFHNSKLRNYIIQCINEL